ncbi:hypothetical protein VPHF94_0096 [Vibrio phage F94]
MRAIFKMITKQTTQYVSHYKASPVANLPIAKVVTEYTLTKIHFDNVDKFNHTLGFLERRCNKLGTHPVRQKYFPIGNFDKITVDKRNRKVYLVKRTNKQRFDIIV